MKVGGWRTRGLMAVGLACLFMLPATSASGSDTPYDLAGQYDAEAHGISLDWSFDGTLGTDDYFLVYANDEIVGMTTTTTFSESLVDWNGVPRTYYVTAVIDDDESDPSNQVTFLATPDVDGSCRVVQILIDPTRVPPFDFRVHPECLPTGPP